MDTVQRVIITVILVGPLVAAGAIYLGLVQDGTIPPLDLLAFAQTVAPIATGGLAVGVGLVLTAIIACAIIAPIIYAARSGDVLTVLISLVLTTTAITFFLNAKSAIHEILAVLVYLANIVLSAVVYAASRIVRSRR